MSQKNSPVNDAGSPAHGGELAPVTVAQSPQPQVMRKRQQAVPGGELRRGYERMDTGISEDDMISFVKFSPEKVSRFFEQHGINRTDASVFTRHHVDGVLAPLLDERHLKEMGVNTIGPRLQLLHLLHKIKTGSRIARRNQILYEALEWRQENNGPCCPCVPYKCPCCCFLPPRRALKLTNASLQITEVKKDGCWDYTYYACCGCIASPDVSVNNIDLSNITDVNRVRMGKECCTYALTQVQVVAEDQGKTETSGAYDIGSFRLAFTEKEGPIFERKLRNAIEEVEQFRGFKMRN